MHAEGLVLREWAATDVPVMVALFDTAEMDRWTPLAHPFAVAAGFREARLLIATDNVGSQKVALAAGFTRTDLPTTRRERKGHVLHLATWTTPSLAFIRRYTP